ncbi:MAG: hypothetical protein WCI46_15240 [Verrucomicrobiota bacterium]
MIETRAAYCGSCQCQRHFRKRCLDHWTQGIVTLSTFGLWAIGWIGLTIRYARKPWRCAHCGSRYRMDWNGGGEIVGKRADSSGAVRRDGDGVKPIKV